MNGNTTTAAIYNQAGSMVAPNSQWVETIFPAAKIWIRSARGSSHQRRVMVALSICKLTRDPWTLTTWKIECKFQISSIGLSKTNTCNTRQNKLKTMTHPKLKPIRATLHIRKPQWKLDPFKRNNQWLVTTNHLQKKLSDTKTCDSTRRANNFKPIKESYKIEGSSTLGKCLTISKKP